MSDTPLTPKEWVALHHIDYMLPDLERYLEAVVALRTQAVLRERDVLKLTVQRIQDHLEVQRRATYQAVEREHIAKQQLSAMQTELAALQCRRDW